MMDHSAEGLRSLEVFGYHCVAWAVFEQVPCGADDPWDVTCLAIQTLPSNNIALLNVRTKGTSVGSVGV